MNIADLKNPFDYAHPVSDANLFAGRTDALAKVAYILDQAGLGRVNYLAIYGKRAAGKTSLLNMADLLARERSYLTVRIDLTLNECSPKEFFEKLYEELIGEVITEVDLKTTDGRSITPRLVRRVINGQLTDDNMSLEFAESLSSVKDKSSISEMALRTDLEYLSSKVGRPIVILIDEAQVIASQEYVLSVLRTLGARLQGYVFIIAGTAELILTIQKVFGPLLRQFQLAYIEPFAESAEVEECISLPLRSLGLSPGQCFPGISHTASDLRLLTDGNPYEIQLYCHAMFARWQNSETDFMELTSGAIDSVRELLDVGTDAQRHSLLAKIRSLPSQYLWALNILCASLDDATVEQLWVAHCLASDTHMTREAFDGYLEYFVNEEVLEVADGRVHFRGDQFEELFVRLWTVEVDEGEHYHLQLLSRQDYKRVLSRSLEFLLCEIQEQGHNLLRTCCNGMRSSVLRRGIKQLEEHNQGSEVIYTVTYLHEAIVRCGIPEMLDLTTVACTYGTTEAVRWLYAPSALDLDINSNDAFIAAIDRMAALGAQLRGERSSIALDSWPDMLEWIVSSTSSSKMRREMAAVHASVGRNTYSVGDVATAAYHLEVAFSLAPKWTAANNLAYIALKNGNTEKAIEWCNKAFELPCAPKEHALTKYNEAIAFAQAGKFEAASSCLTVASQDFTRVSFPEYTCGYLIVTDVIEGALVYSEKPEVNLLEAIGKALECVNLVVRLRNMGQSTN
jgi:hypothetical protein